MAKSQVTEDDIAQGIQSLGGFGGLSGQKPRRDSPFGSDFAAKRSESKSLPSSNAAEASIAPVLSAPEVSSQVPQVKKFEVVSAPKEELLTVEISKKLTAPNKQISKNTAGRSEGHPKSEECTERITLQMSPAMRDELNELARGLQRGRREKGERITANTLMRVAIQSFIDSFDSKTLSGVSSEEELLREAKKRG